MSHQSRRFFFTYNNFQEEDKSRLSTSLPEGFTYLVFQVEKGENGTPHLQGYAETKSAMRYTTFQSRISPEHPQHVHYEAPRAPAACIAYCKKEESRVEGPWELGEAKKNQDKKATSAEVLDQIRKGEIRLRDVDSDTLLQPNFFSVAEKMRKKITVESRKLRIITLIGAAGIGKSYIAHRIAKGDFVKAVPSNSGVWFVGAEDEPETLLIDEFAGQIKLSQLLQLLDEYPYPLEVKGSFYPARYTTVIITSNIPPDMWYKGDSEANDKRAGRLDCLYRRIGYGKWIYEEGKFYIEIPHEELGRPRSIEDQRKELETLCSQF